MMRRVLKLGLLLAIANPASMGGVADAQYDEDVPPTAGATDLESARQSRQGVVLGSRAVPSVYTVRRGDTLWDITGRFYGNSWGWPQVWSYNPEITNPHWIYPMDHIRLIADGDIPTVLETGDSVMPPQNPQSGTVWLRDEGFLDADALRTAGVIIGSPEEQMLLSNFDEVYLRFEEGSDVHPGTEYTIFREMEEHEREEAEEGQLVRIFGTVRLRSYDRERGMGRAVITEALDPIERGFRVAPIPRHFEAVAPRENDRDISARVVATLRPLRLSADHQIVFVNAGEEQGVQLGNRFFVVRSGDQWRLDRQADSGNYGSVIPEAAEPTEGDYLPEIVAEARVVNVRPETSALMITRSVREIELGAHVEMRQGF